MPLNLLRASYITSWSLLSQSTTAVQKLEHNPERKRPIPHKFEAHKIKLNNITGVLHQAAVYRTQRVCIERDNICEAIGFPGARGRVDCQKDSSQAQDRSHIQD